MNKCKTIKEKTELYIDFDEEEIKDLGWKKNQKFSLTVNKDNDSIMLQPYVNIDIDISSYSREVLEWLIQKSAEDDVSVSSVICDALSRLVDEDDSVSLQKSSSSVLLCEEDNNK